jgi:hypothetical protein
MEETPKPCFEEVNANIRNIYTSPKGDFKVYKKISIFNSSNSVTIKENAFLELSKRLYEEGQSGFLIQEHKEANPKYDSAALPAIAVLASINNDMIMLDIRESSPGKAYDKKSIARQFKLIINKDLFFKYYDVLQNDANIEKHLAEEKKSALFLDLDNEF